MSEFGLTEPFRKELLAHCYRMLASVHEAEDAVQETYLRAWRSWSSFEGRSSLRVWLYRIATNVCLTAIEQRGRRALPSGLGAPATDLSPGVPPDDPAVRFVEPIAETLVTPAPTDPAAIVTLRESLRLALIAALQYLPPKQRAVLILREVLAFPAAEVATMLDTSVAAVKSTLQRARANLESTAPGEVSAPTDPESLALLGDYIAGFENADTAALERALRADAAIEMVGTTTWFSGRVMCLQLLASAVGAPGDWRMIPIIANGQPAVGAYFKGDPYGVAVLTPTPTGLTHIHVFSDPELVPYFGLPRVPAPQAAPGGSC